MKGAKARILVVEDDVIMGMEMSDLLGTFGYDVPAAVSSGKDAVEAAGSRKPDLILMDIRLKGEIDGFAAAAIIRLISQAPIVFLSGYKDNETVKQAGMIRNSFFLTKPLDPARLEGLLKKALAA